MDVEKFERRMWNVIISAFGIVTISLCVYFSYLVLLYSFS